MEAKDRGCIRALQLASARFPSSKIVRISYQDAIEAMQLSESDVDAAVMHLKVCAMVISGRASTDTTDW